MRATVPGFALPRRLAGIGAAVLLGWLATPALASCPFGVTPETARRLFDRLARMSIGEDYRFDGLSTESSVMTVLWSRGGDACPPIRVEAEDCTPLFGLPPLRLRVPPDLSARCPPLETVVRELADGTGAAFSLTLPLAVTLALGAAWLALAGLLAAIGFRARASGRTKLCLLALFLFSLVLDWGCSSGGPGDLRLNLAALWSPELELRWGPAPTALFRVLAWALGSLRDTQIVWTNVVLSAATPILVYGIAVELGVGATAALLAALTVAGHPFYIVFSGVLERQAAYRFAAFGSVLALIGFLRRGGAGSFAAFVLGAILATTSRPEGAHVFAVEAAVVLLVPAPRRTRAVAIAALAVMVPLSFAYLSALESRPPGGSGPLLDRIPILWTVPFTRDYTPLAWIAAWVVGLGLGARRRAAWVAALSIAALDLIWRASGLYSMFVGHDRQIASARYESIVLLPFAIGMALLFQAMLEARPRVKAASAIALALLTAATYARPYETLLRPFTVDYEYRFLRKQALSLPPDSRLYVLDAPIDDVGFLDAHLVGQFAGSRVQFIPWSARRCDDLLGDPSPTYLYLGSTCAELVDEPNRQLPASAYASWLADCASIRGRVAADPVDQVDVPARKMSWHEFKDATVRLSLYRLKDASLCGLGPHYPWRHEDDRAD